MGGKTQASQGSNKKSEERMTQQNCRKQETLPTSGSSMCQRFGCNGVGLSARSRARRMLRESKSEPRHARTATVHVRVKEWRCSTVTDRSPTVILSCSWFPSQMENLWRFPGLVHVLDACMETYKQARNIETDIHACTDTRRYRHKHTEGYIYLHSYRVCRDRNVYA